MVLFNVNIETPKEWIVFGDLLVKIDRENKIKELSKDKSSIELMIKNTEDLLKDLKSEYRKANWINYDKPIKVLKDINDGRHYYDYTMESRIKVLEDISKEPTFDNIVEVINFDSGNPKERLAQYKTFMAFYNNPKIKKELKENLRNNLLKHFEHEIIGETEGSNLEYCSPSKENIKFLKEALKEIK